MSLHLWHDIFHVFCSLSSPNAWFQQSSCFSSDSESALIGQISTHRLQLLHMGVRSGSGSNSCSDNTAPNHTILPYWGVISKECLPIVPNPAACAACFWDIIERNLLVLESQRLSLVGIGTQTIPYFSISIQKSRAIASIFGVIEFLTRVYGMADLHLRVPIGNRHAKDITDLHEGITSVGWNPFGVSLNRSREATPHKSAPNANRIFFVLMYSI